MSNSQSASTPLIRLPYCSTRRIYRKGKLLFDNKNNNNILDYNGWAFSLSRRQRHTSHPAPHTVLQLKNLTLIHVMDAFLTNEESTYKYKRTSGERWTPCLPPYNPTATPPPFPPIQPVMRCLSWNQRTVLFWFSCFFFFLALLSHSGLVPPRWQLLFFCLLAARWRRCLISSCQFKGIAPGQRIVGKDCPPTVPYDAKLLVSKCTNFAGREQEKKSQELFYLSK